MSERGAFLLTLVDALGTPWRGEAAIQIQNDRERVIYEKTKLYDGPARFTNLEGVPHGRHMIHIKGISCLPVSRYTTVLSDQTLEERPLPLLLDEDVVSRFQSSIHFPTFSELSVMGLESLAGVAGRQYHGSITISDRSVLGWERADATYDNFVSQTSDSAKRRALACLFNLYAKMTAAKIDPANSARTAWSLVESVIGVRDDRVFFSMGDDADIASIAGGLSGAGFKASDAGSHIDVPEPNDCNRHQQTFKSKGEFGELQLTFYSKSIGNKIQWCIDADIDDRTGFGHFLDGLYHLVFRTRTNPYLIHQLLCLQGIKPKYDLVVRNAS